MNIHLSLTPLISLMAGILILLMPKLLELHRGVYLIIIGLVACSCVGAMAHQLSRRQNMPECDIDRPLPAAWFEKNASTQCKVPVRRILRLLKLTSAGLRRGCQSRWRSTEVCIVRRRSAWKLHPPVSPRFSDTYKNHAHSAAANITWVNARKSPAQRGQRHVGVT